MDDSRPSAELPPPLPPPLPASPPPPARPWGFWATFGFSVGIAVAALGAQVAVGVFLAIGAAAAHQQLDLQTLSEHGWMWALGTIAMAPFTVGLCCLCAYLRRGLSVPDYLGLKAVPMRSLLGWTLVLFLLAAAGDLVTYLLDKPIVPDSMAKAYRTAGFLPLLWFAVVLVAPVSEEFLFRGFLFTGWSATRLSWIGASLLTSLLWAIIHLQYDAYGILQIFLAGLVFGWARWRTGSLLTTIYLHALMNLIATLEAALLVAHQGG